MAFIAGPVALAPRLQRDALRCAAGRQATFGKRFAGARRRAEIRAGAPEQISADELEAILKDKPGPLRTSVSLLGRLSAIEMQRRVKPTAGQLCEVGTAAYTHVILLLSLFLLQCRSVCLFCQMVWAVSIVSWGHCCRKYAWDHARHHH